MSRLHKKVKKDKSYTKNVRCPYCNKWIYHGEDKYLMEKHYIEKHLGDWNKVEELQLKYRNIGADDTQSRDRLVEKYLRKHRRLPRGFMRTYN